MYYIKKLHVCYEFHQHEVGCLAKSLQKTVLTQTVISGRLLGFGCVLYVGPKNCYQKYNHRMFLE